MPERGVGRQRLQQRQVRPQAIAGKDGRFGVGHADVHLERAGRRARLQAAHFRGDHAVALRWKVHNVTERAVRVQAGADPRRTDRGQASTQTGQRRDGVRCVSADRRHQLDHARIRLGMYRAVDRRHRESVEHSNGRVVERVGDRIDKQQLVFDAE